MTSVTQFLRYAVVGLASNGLLFLGYLALTWLGIGHKVAMTVLYATGVSLTFYFNRSWSFGHRGGYGPAFFRYVAAYAFGYLVNLGLLILLVDWAGFPHRIVQGCMVFGLAVLLFLLQKFWVFPAGRGAIRDRAVGPSPAGNA